ncbi:MAG: restriction endonuclease subunit S [Sedimentisphaerales bacterium]|jgi:type I restriction enzyme S subunit
MKGLQIAKLKDVCEKITVGHVGSMAEQYKSHGIPFLRSQNIKPYNISLDNLVYIDETFNEKLKKSKLCPGDLAIVRTGYPGTAAVIPHSLSVCNCSDLVIIRPGAKVNAQYLCYIFNSVFGQNLVGGRLVGAAQQHFNITTAKELKLSLPPLPIQRKIAAVLSAYNNLIENNNRRIAILERMAEELYREWFVRLRFPGHKKIKITKGVPDGWEIKRMGDIAIFVMGQSPKSEFYNETGDGLPFNQGVGTYGNRFPKKMVYCSSDGRKAQKGDILFSVRAPVGRLNMTDCDMIIGRGLAAIKHREGFNSYLFYLLKVVFANEDIIGNGAIFNAVGKDELAKFPVFQPDHALIEKYDEIASKIDKQITLLIQSLEKLISTRDRLISRLMSGKIDVEKMNIRFPASMQEEIACA